MFFKAQETVHAHTRLGAKDSFNSFGKRKDDLRDFSDVISFDITKLVLQAK